MAAVLWLNRRTPARDPLTLCQSIERIEAVSARTIRPRVPQAGRLSLYLSIKSGTACSARLWRDELMRGKNADTGKLDAFTVKCGTEMLRESRVERGDYELVLTKPATASETAGVSVRALVRLNPRRRPIRAGRSPAG